MATNFNHTAETLNPEINLLGEDATFAVDEALTEAFMEMPTPSVSPETGEMAKAILFIRRAHERILDIYREQYNLAAAEEDAISEALCQYIDALTTGVVVRFIRGQINETDWQNV